MRESTSSWGGTASPENIRWTGSSKRDTDRDKYAFSNWETTSRLEEEEEEEEDEEEKNKKEKEEEEEEKEKEEEEEEKEKY